MFLKGSFVFKLKNTVILVYIIFIDVVSFFLSGVCGMIIKRQRRIKVLKSRSRVRVNTRWLIIGILVYILLHFFLINGIFIFVSRNRVE